LSWLAVRTRAFRELATLLKSGGTMLMSRRDGPCARTGRCGPPPWRGRSVRPSPRARVPGLCQRPDQLGGPHVHWTSMSLRLPDDDAAALPLLRGLILNDEKSCACVGRHLRRMPWDRARPCHPPVAIQGGLLGCSVSPIQVERTGVLQPRTRSGVISLSSDRRPGNASLYQTLLDVLCDLSALPAWPIARPA
jgi:hypothetical protein